MIKAGDLVCSGFSEREARRGNGANCDSAKLQKANALSSVVTVLTLVVWQTRKRRFHASLEPRRGNLNCLIDARTIAAR
jgi:hypothetical protein